MISHRVVIVYAAVLVSLAGSTTASHAQQVADTTSVFVTGPATWADGEGPRLLIDAAHQNFHTAAGRFRPFALLAGRDGFQVAANGLPFSVESLAGADVLVIANAVAAANEQDWTLPAHPAFGTEEIEAVRAWVDAGGALLLIADHMPFGGAAHDLATVFGFHFTNGFATSDPEDPGNDVFTAGEGLLADHPAAAGIDSVRSFTGQAFLADARAQPLLRFGAGAVVLLPAIAWQFDERTARLDASGWLQGATREYGAGRVAVFGEAAMFTAQFAGEQRVPIGLNSPHAPDNARFVLNVLHWLVRQPQADAGSQP